MGFRGGGTVKDMAGVSDGFTNPPGLEPRNTYLAAMAVKKG